ncbi:MAG: hypothetical protein HY985_07250 [Magnetospirillum sp.]|nr:hypothetical protein [Magnetospirillum sp.]
MFGWLKPSRKPSRPVVAAPRGPRAPHPAEVRRAKKTVLSGLDDDAQCRAMVQAVRRLLRQGRGEPER